jgi:hypothetical protein
MKIKYLILFMAIFFNVHMLLSQDFHLKVDNCNLRQNQSFSLKIEVSFFDDLLNNQLDKHFLIPQSNENAFYYSRSLFAEDTGTFQIGPYEIVINNQIFRSDSIYVTVLPPLEPKEGVYFSISTDEENTLLIIEQVYKFNIQYGSGYNSGYINLVEFVPNDVTKMRASMKSSTDEPLNVLKTNFGKDNYHYSIKTYIIKNYSKNKIKLTINDFKNLPSEFIMPDIEMN